MLLRGAIIESMLLNPDHNGLRGDEEDGLRFARCARCDAMVFAGPMGSCHADAYAVRAHRHHSGLCASRHNPEQGPLTDIEADKDERVGLMDLFSGAIGHCKSFDLEN